MRSGPGAEILIERLAILDAKCALAPTFTTETFLHELLMRNVNDHASEKHVPLLLGKGAIHQQPYDLPIGTNYTIF